MIRRLVLAASAVAAMALTGCNGGNTSVNAPPPCLPNQTSTSAQLVYPAPGATGVSPGIAQIVIAVSSPLQPANQWNLALTNSAGAGTFTGTLQTITASQLPTGSASTTISNPTYESAAPTASLYQTFTSGTTVQVNLNYNGDCVPNAIPNGAFTLQ